MVESVWSGAQDTVAFLSFESHFTNIARGVIDTRDVVFYLSMTALALCSPLPAMAACGDVPDPVVSLSFESRYAADDPSRSKIDIEAEAAAKQALADLDRFISDLSKRSDKAADAGDRDGAACVMAALATWAQADALSDLVGDTVQLTIGSRIAALAMIAAQVAPAAPTCLLYTSPSPRD